MYEDKTYESILSDAQDEVSGNVLKTEGSLVFNALSALAYEMSKLYQQMDYIINQSHAETADLEHLILICNDRGIIRKTATHAYVEVTANVSIPVGTRFSLKGYNYRITEETDTANHVHTAIVEETGSGANELTGELTVIDHVDGLNVATVTKALILGEDDETKDELYKRYLESFQTGSFGGNIAAYKSTVNAIDGVGGCKVYPVWNGPGTVKVVIASSANGAISDYLLNQIKEAAVPPEKGTGYGFVPIDHTVTFESVEEVPLVITTNITFEDGYTWSSTKEEIESAIKSYIASIAKEWMDQDCTENVTVYISRLESKVLDVAGIKDITGTTLNGSTSNLALAWNQIPTFSEVSLQ